MYVGVVQVNSPPNGTGTACTRSFVWICMGARNARSRCGGALIEEEA